MSSRCRALAAGLTGELHRRGLLQQRVDDLRVLLVLVLRRGHAAAAAGRGLPLKRLLGTPRIPVREELAVVVPAGDGVRVGHRVGAGDVHVVLDQHELGRLVGLLEGVEGDVRGHAGRALRAGEEFHHHDLVRGLVLPPGEHRRLEWRHRSSGTRRRSSLPVWRRGRRLLGLGHLAGLHERVLIRRSARSTGRQPAGLR